MSFAQYRDVTGGYSGWVGDWSRYISTGQTDGLNVWECSHHHASRYDALACAEKYRAMRKWNLVEA